MFIEFRVQCMKIPSSEHVVYINCSECQNKNKTQFMHTTCSELVIFMYWTGNSMNNLLSYCGLVDARISGSEKDLPVSCIPWQGKLKQDWNQFSLSGNELWPAPQGN